MITKEIVHEFIQRMALLSAHVKKVKPTTVRALCTLVRLFFELKEDELPVISPVFTRTIRTTDPFPLRKDEFKIGPCHFGEIEVDFIVKADRVYVTDIQAGNVSLHGAYRKGLAPFDLTNVVHVFKDLDAWEHEEDLMLTDTDREFLLACRTEAIRFTLEYEICNV